MKTSQDPEFGILIAAGLTAPIAHIASAMGLLQTVLISFTAFILRKISLNDIETPGMKRVKVYLAAFAAGGAVTLLNDCWPAQNDMKWILAIFLLLAVYGRSKGREKALDGGILLWWIDAFLFGSILMSALPEIKGRNIQYTILKEDNKKAVELMTVLLLPVFLQKQEVRKGGEVYLALLPILFSLVATGVLGERALRIQAPFYELSRSIRLYGLFDRMESLAWIGLMIGSFLMLSLLLTDIPLEAVKERKGEAFALPVGAAGAFLPGEFLYGGGLLIMAVLIVIWTQLNGFKRNWKKMKKYEKNS